MTLLLRCSPICLFIIPVSMTETREPSIKLSLEGQMRLIQWFSLLGARFVVLEWKVVWASVVSDLLISLFWGSGFGILERCPLIGFPLYLFSGE